MNELISVIVPVYNPGAYLVPCMESLLYQTHQNLDIILVDDGSTDGSGAVCDEFALRDKRIRVLHQKNGGVSTARNAGLDQARGDYLFFLDSDDLLMPESLAVLCQRMEKHALVSGSMQQIDEAGLPGTDGLFLRDQQLSAEQMLHLLFHEEEQGYQGFMCNKLFDLRLIREHGLRFDPAIRYNEDRLFITEYLLQAREAAMIPDVVYLYRIHAASAQGAIGAAFKSAALTELDAFERMYELLCPGHPALACRVARLCFEKSLYWLGRIPKENRTDRTKARRLLRTNARRCASGEKVGLLNKLKIIAHCLLER